MHRKLLDHPFAGARTKHKYDATFNFFAVAQFFDHNSRPRRHVPNVYYSYVWNFSKTTALKEQKPLREHKNSKFILFGSEKRRVTQVDVLIKESLFILLRNNEWDTYLYVKVHQIIFHLLKERTTLKKVWCHRSHFASFKVRPSNVTELYNKNDMMMTILY